MKKRPLSVSIISWFLIVSAGISLFTFSASLNNPQAKELMSKNLMPIPVQYGMLYLGLAISVLCGIMMLKGKNWARLLYIIWGAVGMVIGFITSPMKMMMIPGLVFLAIFAFFLFRPKANEYFQNQ